MSSELFDLEISHYTLPEIERFFKLNPKREYTKTDIDEKEYKIRQQLLQSGHINGRIRRDLIDFLEKAKQWLIDVRSLKESPATLIPKDAGRPIDPFDYPKSAEPLSRETELTSRPLTQFVYTNPSAVFPGIINPLDRRITTKVLNIDTKFREDYVKFPSTNFQLNLPEKITNVVSMSLTAIEIPQTYYNISESYGNNFLYIATRDQFFYDYRIFTIPDGNYTASTLISTLNLLLCPLYSDGLECEDSLFSYIEFVLDVGKDGSGSGRVVLQRKTRDQPLLFINLDFTRDIDGNVDNKPISQKLGWTLGFLFDKYEGCITYESEAPVQIDTIPYFYLAIDDYNRNCNNTVVNAYLHSVLPPFVLARFSVKNTIGDFSNIRLVEKDGLLGGVRDYFGPVDIQRLKIQLLDSYGRVIDLQGRDFSFCLTFQIMYDL